MATEAKYKEIRLDDMIKSDWQRLDAALSYQLRMLADEKSYYLETLKAPRTVSDHFLTRPRRFLDKNVAHVTTLTGWSGESGNFHTVRTRFDPDEISLGELKPFIEEVSKLRDVCNTIDFEYIQY